jgi:hypothetical protein
VRVTTAGLLVLVVAIIMGARFHGGVFAVFVIAVLLALLTLYAHSAWDPLPGSSRLLRGPVRQCDGASDPSIGIGVNPDPWMRVTARLTDDLEQAHSIVRTLPGRFPHSIFPIETYAAIRESASPNGGRRRL